MCKTSPLPGDHSYPARRALTVAVLDWINSDPIESALYIGERRSIEGDRPLTLPPLDADRWP